MEQNIKKNLIIFLITLIVALVYWRTYIFLFYNGGNLSFLRYATNLTIHHHHYGILFITIGVMMLIINKINKFSIILTGFGLGTMLDGFISSLLPKQTIRAQEIANYNTAFTSTILLFSIIITLGILYYTANYSNKNGRKKP